jgi:hypothetical protein
MSAWHEIIGASTYAHEILDCLVNAPRIELTGESLRRIFVKPSDLLDEELRRRKKLTRPPRAAPRP